MGRICRGIGVSGAPFSRSLCVTKQLLANGASTAVTSHNLTTAAYAGWDKSCLGTVASLRECLSKGCAGAGLGAAAGARNAGVSGIEVPKRAPTHNHAFERSQLPGYALRARPARRSIHR